jgi:nucleotide-binding universal stress UspA family protein
MTMAAGRGGILLATHGSPAARQATDVALELAAARDAALTIVHVVAPIEHRVARLLPPIPIARRLADPYRDPVLLDGRRVAFEHGATIDPVLLAGDARPLIAAWARRHDHDLIVIGASSHPWPTFAAPARAYLARHAPCRLLVVKPPAHRPARRAPRPQPPLWDLARGGGHARCARDRLPHRRAHTPAAACCLASLTVSAPALGG